MKFLKILGVTFISVIMLLYFAILFVLPNVVNLNNFKPDFQKIAKEQAGLIVDYSNAKITVTPLLSAGIKADDISIKLADNSELAVAKSLVFRVSLLELIFSKINVTKAEILNPQINIDIADSKEYKIVKHFENLSKQQSSNEQNIEQNVDSVDSVDISSIKINVPNVKFLNYSLLVNDLKTKDFLKLRGDELDFSYNNGKTLGIKTIAELFVNNDKNIIANIDIDSFIPEFNSEEQNIQTENNEKPIEFINLVSVYKSYNLKTNIDTKLKIRQKNNNIVSKGYLNVDNLTLLLSGTKLPESNLHIKTNETEVNADTEIYITDIEKINITANGDYGKNPKLKADIKSNEIHVNNILKLVEAALNTANIKNDINKFKATGYFIADTNFETDFKKLNSKGSVIFKDIDIKDEKNSQLAKINSTISLDDNILKFVDTDVEILGAMFKIDGTIDKKSYADIKVVMQKMPLDKLFTLFMPKEINNNYTVNSGEVNLTSNLTGELKNLKGSANVSLSNMAIKDKVNGFNYYNNLLSADFESDFKTFKGNVNNSDFKMTMNGANVSCDRFSFDVGDKDIIINPSIVKVNNSTQFSVDGSVKDYIDNPVFDIKGQGNLKTSDLKQLLGKDLAQYIKEKGTLPLNVNITGDSRKQTINANVTADKDNYITAVDIADVLNKNTTINVVVDVQDNKLAIHDTGFYVNEGSSKTRIAEVEGTISKIDTKNPVINTIKVKVPNEINASLVLFPQSKLTAKADVVLSGDLNNPNIRGDVIASNISIPEIYTTLEKAALKFEDKNLDLELKKLIANGSDFNIVVNADLARNDEFTILTLNIISDMLDADKVAKVTEELDKYINPSSNQGKGGASGASSQNTASDIPIVIKDGSIDIKELRSGAMKFLETTGKISMSNNNFNVKNLVTSGFDGKINGNVSMNVKTSEIKANLKGEGLDVEKTLLETANMKDTLTGTMDFGANVSLKGSNYNEQVKSLKGNVDFVMKDGSLGPLGKIENLVSADNISSSSAVRTLLNSTIKSTVDTSKYSTVKGNLSFDKGVAQINPITSSGDYMSTYIFGDFDILQNNADLKVRGRLGSKVTDSMGQLALLNPVNIVKSTSNINPILGTLLLTLCEQVTDNELSQIPSITKETSDDNTAKFQVILRGNVANPIKLVRSFKWLATDKQIKDAKTTLSTQPLSIPTNLNDVKQQAKDIIKGLTSEGTNQTTQQGKDAVNAVKSLFKGGAKNFLKEQVKTEE